MKKFIPAIVAVVLIVILAVSILGKKVTDKYSYSDEKADVYEYFNLVTPEEIAIVLQNELKAEKAIRKDGVCYFDLATVHAYFNDRFYIDETEQLLLYTTATEIIRTEIGTNEYTVNGEKKDAGYQLCYAKGEGEEAAYYIAADFVKQYTNFSYEVFDDPNRMQVYTVWEEETVADISEDTAVRVLGGVKSAILREVAAAERVVVLDKMETWCKVKTNDGYIGYVENKFLENERAESGTPVTDYVAPEYTTLKKDGKISLAWHAIYAKSGNDTLKEKAADAKGLTVISPTWFSVKDNAGNLESFASASYVEEAHKMGLEVWGAVDDFNYELNNKKSVDVPGILKNTTKRTALIDNIMKEALACKMDGINIDFEYIEDAKQVRHLYSFCVNYPSDAEKRDWYCPWTIMFLMISDPIMI